MTQFNHYLMCARCCFKHELLSPDAAGLEVDTSKSPLSFTAPIGTKSPQFFHVRFECQKCDAVTYLPVQPYTKE